MQLKNRILIMKAKEIHYFSDLLAKVLIIRIHPDARSSECQIKNRNQKCKANFERMKKYSQESVDNNTCILLHICILFIY
jgi:hypothetical protein